MFDRTIDSTVLCLTVLFCLTTLLIPYILYMYSYNE